MSEITCKVCGKVLTPEEIRLNERGIKGLRKNSYLCRGCRKKEYNSYTNSVKKLIEKRELD
ncbi:MAG TPA: hypothetical protein VM050_13115 [Patescibacteria group bacterium]|nr:hypothetical protein [Patescibacteria group bacterium]